MNEVVRINDICYVVKHLNSLDTLQAINLSKNLKVELLSQNKEQELDEELVEVLCEFSVLSSYCLFKDDKRAFDNPMEVLKSLSIDNLCDVYDTYVKIANEKDKEFSVNESFSYDAIAGRKGVGHENI